MVLNFMAQTIINDITKYYYPFYFQSPRGRSLKHVPIAHQNFQAPRASGRPLNAHPDLRNIVDLPAGLVSIIVWTVGIAYMVVTMWMTWRPIRWPYSCAEDNRGIGPKPL